MRELDITGHRFERLVAVERVREPGWERTRWRMRCDCGGETIVKPGELKRKHVQSCGCLRKEKLGALNRTHGLPKTPTYNAWVGMRARCNNPNTKGFKNWGGRGITICEQWSNFENFLADMGERPEGLSLDRIDNDGNYEPGNCRWATAKQQSENRRPSRGWCRKPKPDTRGESSRELD